ncbi:MAG: hypothetical protein RIA71_12580 [Oceanicaulis sp.]
MDAVMVVGGFLLVFGVVFLAAGLAPKAAVLAAVTRRLEITGPFERGAALVSGLLFLASGGLVSLGLENLR